MFGCRLGLRIRISIKAGMQPVTKRKRTMYLFSVGLFLTSAIFAVGFVGNVWAASFRDLHYAQYIHHSYFCIAGAAVFFAFSVLLLVFARRE
jgi:hypothetical protein